MSLVNTTVAQAHRQSGLKKPRPLRSLSVQAVNGKQEGEGHFLTSAKFRSVENLEVDQSGLVANMALPVCSEIAAMSAHVLACASEHEKVQRYNSYSGQDSHSSYGTCGYPRVFQRQDSATSTGSLEHLSNTSFSYPGSGSSISSMESPSNSSNNHSFEVSNKLIVTTLVTGKGEELFLSGRNMQTILLASKVLLKELNAKIIKISADEWCSNNNNSEEDSVTVFQDNKCCFPDSPDSGSQEFFIRGKPNLSRHYSKRELLELSKSVLSRQPPDKWNVLSYTHSCCCLPASKVTHYFDPSDFHCHDGTLVVPDQRITNIGYMDRQRD